MQEPEITILDWVIQLVKNPDRLAAFFDTPEEMLEDEDLTPKQKEVLLSRDCRRLQHVIDYESNLPEGAAYIHFIFPMQMHNLFGSQS
jgi:hypothetical protein